MGNLVIIGARGNCVDALDIIAAINGSGTGSWEVAGFLDDDFKALGGEVGGVPVLGSLDEARRLDGVSFVFGIGSPGNFDRRESIFRRLEVPPQRFATLLHPLAVISRFATLGRGSIVFPFAAVGAGAVVGDFVYLLSHAVISHGAAVGSFSCVAAGASVSGGAVVGPGCYLGTNSSLRGGVTVGGGAMIGMGSVVLNDVEEGSVMAGNPARRLGGAKGGPAGDPG